MLLSQIMAKSNLYSLSIIARFMITPSTSEMEYPCQLVINENSSRKDALKKSTGYGEVERMRWFSRPRPTESGPEGCWFSWC